MEKEYKVGDMFIYVPTEKGAPYDTIIKIVAVLKDNEYNIILNIENNIEDWTKCHKYFLDTNCSQIKNLKMIEILYEL